MSPWKINGLNSKDRTLAVAAGYFAKMLRAPIGPNEERAICEWSDSDPKNEQSLTAVEEAWLEAGRVHEDPEIRALRESALRRYAKKPLATWVPMAMAAACIAALLIVSGWVFYAAPFAPETRFETGVGQVSDIALTDGSKMTLDTDTVVRTKFSHGQRLLWLDKGRAFFSVAKDANRPFIVQAMGKSVTAKGTQFEVKLAQQKFSVILVEGRVKVTFPSLDGQHSVSTDLTPGTRLTEVSGSSWMISPFQDSSYMSWREGRLVFHDRPLKEIVEQINRYSARKIYLADPPLANHLIYGSFSNRDIDQFVQVLLDDNVAQVETEDATRIVLKSPPGKSGGTQASADGAAYTQDQ